MALENSNSPGLFHRVFVYGTLKKDEPNHYLLADIKNGSGRLVGNGKTIKKYPLVIASKFNIPFLLSEEGVGNFIQGEIYEVDNKMLEELDKLENHPTYYTRRLEPIQLLSVVNGENLTVVQCWTYFLCKFEPNLLKLPYLENYSSSGDHNLPYVDSEETTSVDDIDQPMCQ